MDLTKWTVNVLEKSCNRKISDANRDWLWDNVNKLHICVCVDDCTVDASKIARVCHEKENKLIQEGKYITKSDFQPEKEALLLLKNKSIKFNSEDTYTVFLYYPKE